MMPLDLPNTLEVLDIASLAAHCERHPNIRRVVREVLLFEAVDSTNRVAMEMASSGMPGGIVIFAEAQRAGRGRRGRAWFSPPGVNLYLSFFLTPYDPPETFPLFSFAAALAVVMAIRETMGLSAQIKWPNDVLLDGKKVAGVLLESATRREGNAPLIVGIGINVNAMNFPPEIAAQATSLQQATGRPVDRNAVARTLLEAFSTQCLLLGGNQRATLMKTVRTLCPTLGKRVCIAAPGRIYEGIAEDIAPDGALILRMGDGHVRHLHAGEVTRLRESP